MATKKNTFIAAVLGLALLLFVWEVAPARWAALLLIIFVLALMFRALPRLGASLSPT